MNTHSAKPIWFYPLIVIVVLIVLFTFIFSKMISESGHHRQYNDLYNVLWVQTSAEYMVSAIQLYATAKSHLEQALASNESVAVEVDGDRIVEHLPPAIIMDIDETVLDNSRLQGDLLYRRETWEPRKWDKWVASAEATAIPGAVDFINTAVSKGITVFFVSNRECSVRNVFKGACPQETDTILNLQKIGLNNLDPEHVLLQGETFSWGSDKSSRRKKITETHKVIMMFGDDLADFLPDVKKGITPSEREKQALTYQSRWGKSWFLFPNPLYGSWVDILKQPKLDYLEYLKRASP